MTESRALFIRHLGGSPPSGLTSGRITDATSTATSRPGAAESLRR